MSDEDGYKSRSPAGRRGNDNASPARSWRSRSGSASRSRSRSRSRSPSRSPVSKHKNRSRSPSHSPPRKGRRRSYSRSYSRSRSRSNSRSRHRRRYSRSRSRSFSPYRRRGGGGGRFGRGRRRGSRSPMSSRKRHQGNRFNPNPCRVIGVFGLSLYTGEKELKELFNKYGPIEEVQVVYDHQTGRSRGFAFIYYEDTEDAIDAKEHCNGMEIDGRKIRVDYSITKRAHTPTPGVYMGKPTKSSYDDRDRDRDRGRHDDDRDDYYYDKGRSSGRSRH